MVQYFQGDLLTSGCDVICHQTNCMGVMYSGIARQIRMRYPESYEVLRHRFKNGKARLGECDFVLVRSENFTNGYGYGVVVNCYSQFDYLRRCISWAFAKEVTDSADRAGKYQQF